MILFQFCIGQNIVPASVCTFVEEALGVAQLFRVGFDVSKGGRLGDLSAKAGWQRYVQEFGNALYFRFELAQQIIKMHEQYIGQMFEIPPCLDVAHIGSEGVALLFPLKPPLADPPLPESMDIFWTARKWFASPR